MDGGRRRSDRVGLGVEWRLEQKKNGPPSSNRTPVVKELERDSLRERDG